MTKRNITPKQQRQKDRLDAARKEIRAAIEEHECFTVSEGNSECWICAKKYVDGKFQNVMYVTGVRPVAPAPPPPKPTECLCAKDSDGECPACKGAISGMILKLTDLAARTIADFQSITESADRPYCFGCGQRYVDYGMAKAFKGVFGQFGSREVVNEILVSLFKAMRGMGLTEAPLTLKAWADLCREKGWDRG